MYYLTKIDPQCNCRRYYLLGVQPTLLGEHCLIRQWGRIGGHMHTLPPEPFPDTVQAHRQVNRLLQQKLKRGYQLTSDHAQSP